MYTEICVGQKFELTEKVIKNGFLKVIALKTKSSSNHLLYVWQCIYVIYIIIYDYSNEEYDSCYHFFYFIFCFK